MSRKIKVKILAAIISLFIILIGLTLDTLIFNSIVISHYGGLSAAYSPYILSLTIATVVGISFFSPSILSLINVKPPVAKFFLLMVIASFSCFIFIAVAWRLQVGMYGNTILDVFSQHIYYIFVSAFVIQLLFIEKLLSNSIQKHSKQKAILRVLVFQITVLFSFSLLNIGSIYQSYELRESQPNYTKGNSRTFRVILGEKCGISPPIIDGKMIIEFPENGIVIIRNDEDEIYQGQCKFYFTDDDQKKELHIFEYWDVEAEFANEYERKNNVKGMNSSRTQYILAPEGDGTYSSEAPGAITYWDFTLHSKSFPFKESADRKKDIQTLTKLLVRKCRKKKRSTTKPKLD